VIAPLERFPSNPLLTPARVRYARASGTFNPGAAIDHRSGHIVLLVRVFDAESRRSTLALALSDDGRTVDELWDHPAIDCAAPYEAWGVEDARITWLADDGRYAITYTGYSPSGPRVCLITTDDLLTPERYERHGPRLAGDNKNCVVFPERVDGSYVILHRPMPRVECVRVRRLEDAWPSRGTTLLGPRANSWRSARVGAGAPPIRTEAGWLFPFHGATRIEEGNVYSMGWCVLDVTHPETVRYVSETPALSPVAPYEIEHGPIPQVDAANFRTGIRVVFPQGLVEHGDDLLVYYGAADVAVAGASVAKRALVTSLAKAIVAGEGAPPL
jgi:predicted GH43/DUF377 family glycosyl hydrolase